MQESLFDKVGGSRPATLLKRDSNMVFFCNIAKILRTPFFVQNNSGGSFCHLNDFHLSKFICQWMKKKTLVHVKPVYNQKLEFLRFFSFISRDVFHNLSCIAFCLIKVLTCTFNRKHEIS